ncbi:toll-like receptor 7 [Anopheles nili]|uniref:toll-like receptor 7 n=1 Tax=Anopheles nili TaxID=185578 RepID=UPI00237B6BA2|nr:toll-like receptor 7 [Anopheles nili]
MQQPVVMYLGCLIVLLAVVFGAEKVNAGPRPEDVTEGDASVSDGVVFSNASKVTIEDSNIEILLSDVFRPYRELRIFHMAARLRSVKSDAFASVPALVELNLDNNFLSTVPKDALQELRVLETLSIRSNLLEALSDGDEFFSLPNLRSLSLSWNNISYIHSNTFANLNHLRTLDLCGNSLSALDDSIFHKSPMLEELDLSFNYIIQFTMSHFHYSIELRKLSLAGNLYDTLPSNIFATLRHLERLDLSKNFLKVLPERLVSSNHALEQLDLGSNLIETIPANAFLGLVNLFILNLRNNRLTSVPEGLLRDQSEFIQLSWEGNRLDRFEEGLFLGSSIELQNNRLRLVGKIPLVNRSHVQRLMLYGNEIEVIEADSLDGLTRLEEIYLSNNRIGELPSMLFQTCDHLRHVTCSYNRLTVLRTNTFSGLSRLHSVDLSNNQLSIIEPAVFHGSPVEYLNLNGNLLTTLDSWAFSGTRLRYLFVDSNKITSLDQDLSVLNELRELSAAKNVIKFGAECPLRNFTQLTYVDLTNNSLDSVGSGCWERQSAHTHSFRVSMAFNKLSDPPLFSGRFDTLDLSGNNISDLGDGSRFRGYQEMETLLLGKTSLGELRAENFAFLPNLTAITVSSDRLKQIDENTFHLLKLKRLEITHSPLKKLPALLLKGQTILLHVSFANNDLLELQEDFFTDCSQLTMVDLSGNWLTTVYRQWFAEQASLSSVDLSDNKITHIPSDLFSPKTHSPTIFSIAGNELVSIANATFLAEVPITWLNLSRTGLDNIDILNRNEFINLLDVSGNQLDHLLVRAKYIDVFANSNRITSLQWEKSGKFELEILELADNELEQLDLRVFEAKRIRNVDVSGNRLSNVPFEALHKARLLLELNVSRNNIRTLPVDPIRRFKLETLDLSENPIEVLPEGFLSSAIVNDLITNIAK